ncbi:MAG: hypothetical protein MRERC_5c083 [Mycoplasmataceae bacterium RC_NB112A]|nr:MAG: hypothetical protein MRERC_5c083 [Mycoplasmataceae bacterium RC_NB112A]
MKKKKRPQGDVSFDLVQKVMRQPNPVLKKIETLTTKLCRWTCLTAVRYLTTLEFNF